MFDNHIVRSCSKPELGNVKRINVGLSLQSRNMRREIRVKDQQT